MLYTCFFTTKQTKAPECVIFFPFILSEKWFFYGIVPKKASETILSAAFALCRVCWRRDKKEKGHFVKIVGKEKQSSKTEHIKNENCHIV